MFPLLCPEYLSQVILKRGTTIDCKSLATKQVYYGKHERTEERLLQRWLEGQRAAQVKTGIGKVHCVQRSDFLAGPNWINVIVLGFMAACIRLCLYIYGNVDYYFSYHFDRMLYIYLDSVQESRLLVQCLCGCTGTGQYFKNLNKASGKQGSSWLEHR